MKRKVVSLVLVVLCFALNACANKMQPSKGESFTDSLQVKLYSKGKIIKVSSNPTSNGSLNIIARSADELHFYVFDITGTLMHRATLNDKEGSKLPPLQKGVYLYDVFKNDLSIEEGRIVIQ